MKIQGLEKLSLVDYDGYTACTVFLAGCNLRCPYCHNAPLLCGDLPEAISEQDFFAFLAQRKDVLDAVCISGGEPTLRKDLPDFCRRIKDCGYRVKLDTNGTNPDLLRALVLNGLVDYVAMDVKAPLSEYAELLCADSAQAPRIKESIEFLIHGTLPFEFRTTLVDEMIDERAIREMASLLRGAPKLFLQKFEDRGNNLVDELTPVPLESAERYASILRETVTEVFLRGYP